MNEPSVIAGATEVVAVPATGQSPYRDCVRGEFDTSCSRLRDGTAECGFGVIRHRLRPVRA